MNAICHRNPSSLLASLGLVAAFGTLGAVDVVAAPVALINATVEVGDGTVIEGGTVVFDGPKILRVGKGVNTAGATIVDAAGKVVAPGFVALLSQVGLFEIGLEDAATDHTMRGHLQPGFRAAEGFNPMSLHVPLDREEGITSAVLSPVAGPMVAGSGDLVEFRFSVDAGVESKLPVAMFGRFNGGVADHFGGARGRALEVLRELIEDTRFYLKNKAAYDRGQSRILSASRVDLEAMVPVVQGKIPFVVDVDRASDIIAFLDLAKEQKLKLVVESGKESWLVAERLKAQKVPVIVLPSYSGSISFDALHARDDLATVLHDAGVTVLIRSWESENGTNRSRQEAGIAIANGLPRAVAIKAIAQGPAEVFGLTHNRQPVGILKPGARANVVMWTGDPLETSSVVERLWVAGEAVTTSSRSRLLADRYLKEIRRTQKAASAP